MRSHYRPRSRVAALVPLFLATGGAARAEEGVRVELLAPPAPEQSLTPFLAASSDRLYLSWLEKTPEGHRLRLTSWDGARFEEPGTIRASKDLFANWADFASVLPFGNHRLAAHWLEKSAGGTYDYDVFVALSDDGGKSFGPPERLNRDGKRGEHGFVSLARHERGFAAAWLDGRNFEKDAPDNEMALMFATFDGDSYSEETILDARVCECCQTAMAEVKRGHFVAYRDRSEGEIRDIAYVRSEERAWDEPRTIHADGWHLTGCPVNGPQAASDGDRLALVWFTASSGDPRVQIVFSEDSGASFGEPVRVDGGGAIGRVDVEWLGGDAFVSWLARGEARSGGVRVRRISPRGAPRGEVSVARTSSERASGFPRMAAFQGRIYVAWTESTSAREPSWIHLARLVLE
jgi:type II secretory pathway component PulM